MLHYAYEARADLSPWQGQLEVAEDLKVAGEITGKPYDFPDPKTLPQWDFLYKVHLMRGEVGGSVAAGGLGKTTLSVGEVLAMASNKKLLHDSARRPLRVLLINLEDKRDVIDKRIAAAMSYYNLTPEDIGDRLFVKCKGELKFRANNRQSVERLIRFIKAEQFDVVSIDPFIRTHDVDENDNQAMQKVVEAYEDIALECNCAISLWHHTRKSNGNGASVDSARGASAFVDACRSVRVLEPMSKDEAKAMHFQEERRSYFKSFSGKLNYSPTPEDCDWYHLVNVSLGNGRDGRMGDNVGVVAGWTAGIPAGPSEEQIGAIKEKLSEGVWRDSVQAAQWAGNAIAPILGLDQDADKEQIKQTLKALLQRGILRRVFRTDEQRRLRQVIVPKEWGDPPAPPPELKVGGKKEKKAP